MYTYANNTKIADIAADEFPRSPPGAFWMESIVLNNKHICK